MSTPNPFAAMNFGELSKRKEKEDTQNEKTGKKGKDKGKEKKEDDPPTEHIPMDKPTGFSFGGKRATPSPSPPPSSPEDLFGDEEEELPEELPVAKKQKTQDDEMERYRLILSIKSKQECLGSKGRVFADLTDDEIARKSNEELAQFSTFLNMEGNRLHASRTLGEPILMFCGALEAIYPQKFTGLGARMEAEILSDGASPLFQEVALKYYKELNILFTPEMQLAMRMYHVFEKVVEQNSRHEGQ